jgi:hypothetical protein
MATSAPHSRESQAESWSKDGFAGARENVGIRGQVDVCAADNDDAGSRHQDAEPLLNAPVSV